MEVREVAAHSGARAVGDHVQDNHGRALHPETSVAGSPVKMANQRLQVHTVDSRDEVSQRSAWLKTKALA